MTSRIKSRDSGFVLPLEPPVIPPSLHAVAVVLASEPGAALPLVKRVRDAQGVPALAVIPMGSRERRLPLALGSVSVARVHPDSAVASLAVEPLKSFLLFPREGAPLVAEAAKRHPGLRAAHGTGDEITSVLLQPHSTKAIEGWRPEKTSGQAVDRFLSGLEDPSHFDVVVPDGRCGLPLPAHAHQRHEIGGAVVVLRVKVHAGAGF